MCEYTYKKKIHSILYSTFFGVKDLRTGKEFACGKQHIRTVSPLVECD